MTPKKTQIFKLHGDLSSPESIIITKKDYTKFFENDNKNSPYWSVVKERLSTKNILFIGYNLEDINIESIFNEITSAFNVNSRQSFLVAPSLPTHKITDLQSKGISYIDSTAENLLDELIKNLDKNIISDAENNTISPKTFSEYIANKNLKPNLICEGDSFQIGSLKPISGKNVKQKVNFSLKDNKETIKRFTDFISGVDKNELELSQSDFISFEHTISGLTASNEKSFDNIKIYKKPNHNTKFDLRFDNGLEHNDIPIKVYGSKSKIKFEISFKCFSLTISLFLNGKPNFKYDFTFLHNQKISKVSIEINELEVLKALSQGIKFSAFHKGKNVFSNQLSVFPKLVDEVDFYINFFRNLKTIEKEFEVQFNDIELKKLDDTSFLISEKIVKVINNGFFDQEYEGELNIPIDSYSELTLKLVSEINSNFIGFSADDGECEIVDFLGHSINIGYKRIELYNPKITNYKKVMDSKNDELKIKSKINKIKICYSKEKTNNQILFDIGN